MSIFDMNGQLMDALRKFSDIVLFNILFCLFSLPVITAGAALVALCEGVRNVAENRDYGLAGIRNFAGTFFGSFKRATPIYLGVLAVVAVLASMRQSASVMPGPISKIYGISFYFLAMIAALGYQHLFPLLAANEETRGFKAIKQSFLMAIAFLPWTLAGIAGTGAFIYITLILNNNAFKFGIFLWLACGFGLCAYLNSFIFLHIRKTVGQAGNKEQS